MKNKRKLQIVRAVLEDFLNLLFPENCPVCGNRGDRAETFPVCRVCWDKIEPYNGPLCKVCGRFLVSQEALTCGECLKDAPRFEYARSFSLYDGAIKEAIHHLKYHGRRNLARPLAALLTPLPFEEIDVIVPVPIHYNRLRAREFNQSCLLSRELSLLTGITFAVDSLVKIKDTRPQVGLIRKERKENVKNAFQVKDSAKVADKRVLLIDDVITTSATVRECSKELKKAGAKAIVVTALA